MRGVTWQLSPSLHKIRPSSWCGWTSISFVMYTSVRTCMSAIGSTMWHYMAFQSISTQMEMQTGREIVQQFKP